MPEISKRQNKSTDDNDSRESMDELNENEVDDCRNEAGEVEDETTPRADDNNENDNDENDNDENDNDDDGDLDEEDDEDRR